MENRATQASDPGCQIYLISPPTIDFSFGNRLKSALSAGAVAAFQLRLKGIAADGIARLAEPLRSICAANDVAFIVNDDMHLAKRIGADGVHLGQGDGDPREARALLGPTAQIGMTCHNSRHLAMEAGELGVDYVAFGAFFNSGTKKVEFRADLEILRWWSGLFELPCVAIGGILPQNASELASAGADFIAVSAGVWDSPLGEAGAVQVYLQAVNQKG
jgi:thiamine-phosphate pyrophosphorylase